MPSSWYILSGVLIATAVTWTMRAAPFAMLAPLRSSELLAHVSQRMPVGIMVILTAYTLRDLQPSAAVAWPTLVALAVTVGLQLWRHSATLSIFTGTAVHVVLASVLAAS